jgi:segregation and condensation protein B
MKGEHREPDSSSQDNAGKPAEAPKPMQEGGLNAPVPENPAGAAEEQGSCVDEPWDEEPPAGEGATTEAQAAHAPSHDALFENYDNARPVVPENALEPNPQADRLRGIIESILFVSDTPVTLKKICDAAPDYEKKDITKALAELRAEYNRSGRGFLIEEIAGGYQMLSNPENVEYVRRLHEKESSSKLTPAMLETLAIIAYKQPVLRADIEAVRGVQVGPIIRSLMEKGMVRVAGRADEAGKPFLYGTTKQFLEHFGLRSIEDLPNIEELKPPSN